MKLTISPILAQRGMTQSALAAAVDIRPGFMSEIISGKKAPSMETLVRIADVLQVPVGDLFVEPPAPPPPSDAATYPPGLADDAVPFVWGKHAMSDTTKIMENATAAVRHPATYQVTHALPWLALLSGDVLVCDLATQPVDGDVILVGMTDADGFNARTLVRRFWHGQAISPDPTEKDPLVNLGSDARAAWRATVTGVVRLKL